jgi:DNA-binding NarL/FixJ family response regulator
LIRIFIADDHAMFAEGLESLLRNEPDFELCGKAVTAVETLDAIPVSRPDVLLLDINLPDHSGMYVTEHVRREFPNVKIIALTMHNDESYITEMLNMSIEGYLLKNTDKGELFTAIRTVAAGRTYFCQEVTETLLRGLNQAKNTASTPAPPKISRREREVLRLILDERTTQEIAEQLFVSEKTVESHRAALLAKLGARNMAGMVKAALQWKLLDE